MPPSETLLPETTKGYLSVPDITLLRDAWNATQIGQLTRDPAMEPFVQDVQRQLKARMDSAGARIGITWDDLEGVYGGEVSIAAVQPWDAAAAESAIRDAGQRAAAKAKEAKQSAEQIAEAQTRALAAARLEQDRRRQEQHALVLLVDVTGHTEQAQALLKKIAGNLVERGAKQSTATIEGIAMTALEVPVKRDNTVAGTHMVYYCLHKDVLLAVDHQQIAAGILRRLAGDSAGALAQLPAFANPMQTTHEGFSSTVPQLKWFVEPFGMTEVLRGMAGGRKRRGTDLLKVLANQGFTAVQGLGGAIALSTDEHEMLAHTYIYAPPIVGTDGKPSPERYRLAARMLNFPNSDGLQPPAWVPRELATYFSFNWKMKDAFRYVETLINEYAGDDQVFQDVLRSIETDPHGPMINLEKDLIAHLAERVILIADCRVPVTPKSERVLVAIAVTDPEAVRKTINKTMESDPEAIRRDHNGHIIWEMVAESEIEVETVQIDGPGFGFEPAEMEEVDEEKPFRPNGAITVAKDHLLVATHVDYIEELLDRPEQAETLINDGEYQMIDIALDKLGAGNDCVRLFSRTDEAYRSTYELIRQGKMPEAESLFGKLMNRLFEPEDEGAVREQYIDGAEMPDYEIVRRYLGPAGWFIRSEDEGWSITGCLLNRQAP